METTLHSGDITCGHCAGPVLDAVRAVPGVGEVSIHIENQSVAVIGAAPVDERAIRDALRQAGYGVNAASA